MNDIALVKYYDKLIPFYKTKNYKAALGVILEAEKNLPQFSEHIGYWKCCILSVSGEIEDAISLFEQFVNNGVWWPISSINSEPDFENIRNNPKFIVVLDRINILAKEKQLKSQQQYFFFPKNKTKASIVNIHWKDDTVDHYRKYFDSIYEKLDSSCLYIQSSQVVSSIGFGWDDKEKAIHEIEDNAKTYLDNCRLICGTSQGAKIAFILSQKYKKNYLGIIPAFSEQIFTQSNEFAKVKYRFIVGSEDYYTRYTNELVQLLEKQKCDIQLVVMKDVGHYFPYDFEEYYRIIAEGILT
jgi:hypothetical protein